MKHAALFPVIFVKNRKNETVHLLGSSSHDCLRIDENGFLYYVNMQTGQSTRGQVEYQFVGSDSNALEIEFLPMEQIIKQYGG